MNNDQMTKTAWDDATSYFDAANEELCRPEEDVVPYKVCKNAFLAVRWYLNAFLIKNGRTINDTLPIRTVLNSCQDIDSSFKSLDLSLLSYANAHHDEVAWIDTETVQTYMNLATQARDLIVQKMNQ